MKKCSFQSCIKKNKIKIKIIIIKAPMSQKRENYQARGFGTGLVRFPDRQINGLRLDSEKTVINIFSI